MTWPITTNDAYELSHKTELGVYTVFDVIAVCGYDMDQAQSDLDSLTCARACVPTSIAIATCIAFDTCHATPRQPPRPCLVGATVIAASSSRDQCILRFNNIQRSAKVFFLGCVTHLWAQGASHAT